MNSHPRKSTKRLLFVWPNSFGRWRFSPSGILGLDQSCRNPHLVLQGAMDRTLVGDLEQFRPRCGVERAFELDHPVDAIDAPFLGLAFAAVARVGLLVAQVDTDALQRKFFLVGVHAYGHR